MQEGTGMKEESLEDGVQLARSREDRDRGKGWNKLEVFLIHALFTTFPPF